MNDYRVLFIYKELHEFMLDNKRCCHQLSASFVAVDRILMEDTARRLGIKVTHIAQHGGIRLIKVIKPSCSHELGPCPLEMLVPPRRRQQNFHLISNIVFGNTRPMVVPYSFAFNKQYRLMSHEVNAIPSDASKEIPGFLQALEYNRVLVVNGDASCEKATTLPYALLKAMAARSLLYKIICVEREKLLALHYSERLTLELKERIGMTVAYQVHQQSHISPASSIVYTTASFLLRVLHSQANSWRQMTHVILDDIHRHEAYYDILLCELRKAIRLYPHLRIILLTDASNNAALLAYFGEGVELRLVNRNDKQQTTQVMYAEELRQMLAQHQRDMEQVKGPVHEASPTAIMNHQVNSIYLERCLQLYAESGGQPAYEAFLHMVRAEYGSVNYRHSLTGDTALIIAAKYGNASHLRALLELNADPFINNSSNENTITSAIKNSNADCLLLLKKHMQRVSDDVRPSGVNLQIVIDLLQLLLGAVSPHWPIGNVLIFVSNCEQVARLNFRILREKLVGRLPGTVAVHVLHADTDIAQLNAIFATDNMPGAKILLCTDIAESLGHLPAIRYVIDTGRLEQRVYNASARCSELRYDWVSQDSLRRRCAMIQRGDVGVTACFRLFNVQLLSQLSVEHTPEVLFMPLDRVCLSVKLLAPAIPLVEFLRDCFAPPPVLHIHYTIEHLKSIQILDDTEEVSWLGCRLIDVPIDCQLGKLLVHAILLQCLDPILTIVSFMTFGRDVMGLSVADDPPATRAKLKRERKNLVGDVPSDHLAYIRIFQAWQNKANLENVSGGLIDERQFIMNSLLQHVCDIRTRLVGALRAAHLIHSQGQLNMHYRNAKSHMWPIVKAALVGGLYPQICRLNTQTGRIQASHWRELMLHPDSVLRELRPQPLSEYAPALKSQWLVYTQQTDGVCCTNINNCSAVTTITVALFAGLWNPKNSIIPIGGLDDNTTSQRVQLCIDDNLMFTMHASLAQWVLQMRQSFSADHMNYLQHCSSGDHNLRYTVSFNEQKFILEKALQREENMTGFGVPEKVGLRPKAMVPSMITNYNSPDAFGGDESASPSFTADRRDVAGRGQPSEYFLVYHTDDRDSRDGDYSQKFHMTELLPYLSDDTLTYVIMHDDNQLHTVALVEKFSYAPSSARLHEYFKNRIPIGELLNLCRRFQLPVPTFDECCRPIKLNRVMGNILMDLFAFRNNSR